MKKRLLMLVTILGCAAIIALAGVVKADDASNQADQEKKLSLRNWAVGKTFAVKEQCLYLGNIYECLQAHTVLDSSWDPANTPAFWKYRGASEASAKDIRKWAVGEYFKVGEKCLYEENKKIYECIQAHTVDAPNWTPLNCPNLWTFVCNTITVNWIQHIVTGGALTEEFQKAIDIDIANVSPSGYEAIFVITQGIDEIILMPSGRIGRKYHSFLQIYDPNMGLFRNGELGRDEFFDQDFNDSDHLPNPNFGKYVTMRIAISNSNDWCYPFFLMKNGDIRLRYGSPMGPYYKLAPYLPGKSSYTDISSNQQSSNVYILNNQSIIYYLNYWSNVFTFKGVFSNMNGSWLTCFDMKHNANASIKGEFIFYSDTSSKCTWERYYQNGYYRFRKIGNSIKPQMTDISVQPVTAPDPVIWQIDRDNYLYYWDPINRIWSLCLNGRFERIAVDSEGKPWAIYDDSVFQGTTWTVNK